MKKIDIADKVLKGSRLAVQRMLERRKRDGGYVAVSVNGKVVKMLAKDVKIL